MVFKTILSLLFSTIFSLLLFSQKNDGVRYLQINGGNTSFINPFTRTNSFSPQADLLMVASAKKDSALIAWYYLFGVGYNYSNQVFNVLWSGSNTNKASLDNFFTNEFTFCVGGRMTCKMTKKTQAAFSLVCEGGQNYTWTNDPMGNVYMGRIVTNGSFFSGIAQVPGSNYYTKYRDAHYKWSYVQGYIVPSLGVLSQIEENIFFYIGLSPRFYLFKDFHGPDPDPVKLNYAQVKMSLQIGLLFKVFK